MEWQKNQGFLGSQPSYSRASTVLFGAPMDQTTSYRPGTRYGPQRIRDVSEGLEDFSHRTGSALADVPFFDAGDVEIVLGDVEESLRRIRAASESVVRDGKLPVMMGGEHLVSLPAIEAVYGEFVDLAVIQFDAHADLRETYSGYSLSHATVMRHTAALLGSDNIYQFGIRSGTREEFAFAKRSTRFYPDEVLEPLRAVLPHLLGRPIYLTIDIDVMDAAFVPGTGTPESGGVSSREILEAVYLLQDCNIVGVDIVELSPITDIGDITALMTAKLVRESILCFGKGVKLE